jgi:hypothetical protein
MKESLSNLKFLIIISGLIVTLLIDSSFIKIYDLIDKNFISIDQKKILFSINTLVSIFFQYLLVRHIKNIFSDQKSRLSIGLFYKMAVMSLTITTLIFVFLIFQIFTTTFYFTSPIIFIILLSYGTALSFIIALALLFLSWFNLKHDFVVFLYFLSMLMIAFNLILTATYTILIISDRPYQVREFVGGSMDISVGRYILLDSIYKISGIASFGSIWITTAIILIKYKTRLLNTIVYGVILSMPLVYFLFNYTYGYIFGSLLNYYLTIDPISVSIMLTAFLFLSKPVGGLTFGIVFWKISRDLSYEKNIKKYMTMSGLGVFLLFATNQAIGQTLTPFPPFGLVTTTVIVLAGILTLLGIFNAAIFVSTNNNLQHSIYKRAIEARLLGVIGRAEKDKELKKAIDKIMSDKDIITTNSKLDVDLDEKELKKHVDFVLTEFRKNVNKEDKI